MEDIVIINKSLRKRIGVIFIKDEYEYKNYFNEFRNNSKYKLMTLSEYAQKTKKSVAL